MADVVRLAALGAIGASAVLVPYAIGLHPRPHRTIWLLLGFFALVIAQAARASIHWGEPLRWYGSPLTLLAGVLLIVYSAETICDTARERRDHD